jgi:hypothetical protein
MGDVVIRTIRGSIWWKPVQLAIIAAATMWFYSRGLKNPWAGGLIGFGLAWLATWLINLIASRRSIAGR